MTDRQEIEARIEHLIANESNAAVLSHELFRPGGLFGLLASNRAEREVLVDSPLFRKAQRRLSELQRNEMEDFRRSSLKPVYPNETITPASEIGLTPR